MKDPDRHDEWARKKSGLKKSFGLWAMRHEDAVAATVAWSVVQRAGKRRQWAFLAFGAFIAAYGRLFTGSDALKREKTWIPPEDKDLHEELMAQRNEAIAHSDVRFRTVHLLPPGIDKPGVEFVPAHKVADWRWSVLGGELRSNMDRVGPRLTMLRTECAKRAVKALDDLLEHCRESVIPVREMTLDEF